MSNPKISEFGKATRFRKGQSGNPGGNPLSLSLTRLVLKKLQEPAVEGSTVTNAEMVADKIVNMAKAGHTIFAPLVWRYVDGEPKAAAEQALRELAEQLAPKLNMSADALLKSFLEDLGAA